VTSLEALRRQVEAMRRQIGRPSDPQHWSLVLLDGEDVPPHILQQVREQDTLYIRHIHAQYMPPEPGDQEASIGYVITAQGKTTCLYHSGKTHQVEQRRRR
jgi:hypothetical protein